MSRLIKQTSLITTLFCTFVVFFSINRAESSDKSRNYKKLEILEDLPLKNDSGKYINALGKILDFGMKYKRLVSLNFYFGLLLADVNLRTVHTMKAKSIPSDIDTRLKKMLKKNKGLLAYFQKMFKDYLRKTKSTSPSRYLAAHLISGTTSWSNRLRKFHSELLNITKFYSVRQLKGIYGIWFEYEEKAQEFANFTPTPEDSDRCLSALVRTPVNPGMEWIPCKGNKSCTGIMLNGTDLGYAMSHRLLYFIIARHGIGCTLTTALEDKFHLDNFCANIYKELEFISVHNFALYDLAMEHIALCTLEGHEQFLRSSFIDDLLDFQNDIGCFGPRGEKPREPVAEMYDNENPEWKLEEDVPFVLGGMCNTHSSGVAAAVLSAYLRFLLETHY